MKRYPLFIILALAFFLRMGDLYYPGHFPQPDEMFSLDAATQPTVIDTIHFVAEDTHPPLYFLVLRLWTRILPPTYFSIKFLSILFNVLNIALTWHLAQRWLDRRGADIVALFMALSPWNLYWSHLARNHQMLPVFFTLSTSALLQWMDSRSRKLPILYLVHAAIMVQTNYLSFFILGTHALIILVSLKKDIHRIMVGLAAMGMALMSYLPFAGPFYYQVNHGPMNAGWFQHTVSPGLLFYHFLFFNVFTSDLGDLWYPPPQALPIILAGGAVCAILAIRAVRRIRDHVFYIILLLPPTTTVITGLIIGSTMAERYLGYAVGPWAILMAAGFAGRIRNMPELP